ncbi:Uroporphyrinogen decarboxylase [Desulfonema limicola]|uniref:Uroporphyrinogen decarboxylase n=1 Tax=Desulfonema limicola TaxID=45656 RepID=A0A975BAZ6_9BACT|nr:uroporphyrinogen decarboxylase family protein [Desulfonema limicola]QTA82008.1 Uroporphyrinogen decarboxylase [Desulfonema limicola]
MNRNTMTPMQRVLTALSHKEPDRVPLFLLPTMHGAKELGISIKEYFSKPEYVAQGQLCLLEKYDNDCLSAFFYGSLEVEAWGAEVIYSDDGPPNSGQPFIRKISDIKNLEVPEIAETPCLIKVLETIKILKSKAADKVPIIGVAISPFSLPVMQLGFNRYIKLMYENHELFQQLMKINEKFCIKWANAQLQAGAAAICYFDPVSSSTITTRDMYLKTGFKIAKRTLAGIQGPAATHMASGRSISIINDIVKTGTAAIAVSCDEDIGQIKSMCKNKVSVMGNLNGIEMAGWTPETAEQKVKQVISRAAHGGGFILTDNHGEIPFQVKDEVLYAISNAVHKWGKYPIQNNFA